MSTMLASAVTVSIDLELAWGNWDNLSLATLARVESDERAIVARLLEILDRHAFPATWAVVAGLLDPAAAANRPGPERCWYAPDLIEAIRSSSASHDIGSHGGRHAYLGRIGAAQAEDDLSYAVETYFRAGLACRSFVFPRNDVGQLDLLARYGFKVFRGVDPTWHERIRHRSSLAGRAANLIDKLLPIAPPAVRPARAGELTNLPGSMLLLSRNGLRRFASKATTASKLRRGVARASHHGGTFHLWFHPSNFYWERDAQFALFEEFVANASDLARRGLVVIKPMSSYAA